MVSIYRQTLGGRSLAGLLVVLGSVLILCAYPAQAQRPSLSGLQQQIDDEAAARAASDSDLQQQIDAQQTQIDDLTSRVGALEGAPPTPQLRFIDNGDGTVRDSATGLIWTKNATCSGGIQGNQIEAFCPNLAEGPCGLRDGSVPGDWRLSTLFDLLTVYDATYGQNDWSVPAIPNSAGTGAWSQGDPFWFLAVDVNGDNQADYDDYWFSTSTPYPTGFGYYQINLYKTLGNQGSAAHGGIIKYMVWCVR